MEPVRRLVDRVPQHIHTALMTTTTPAGVSLPGDHLHAIEKALDKITDHAKPNIGSDPSVHLHASAAKEHSHAWARSIFPYSSLQELENAWHLGNYVLDRQTGEKTFEEMSIYVRVGDS